ncbi:MAG: sugar transferase, partial [Acidobacteria bacterium]|nr:sugar transferase [Acidobacteriota bacterium]
SDFELEKPGLPSGKTTDIGNALKGMVDRTVGQDKFRGLLLFSDGADNGTSRQPALPLAQRLRDLSLNVHSFALGKPTTTAGQTDLALVSISTEPTPTIPLGGEISVKVSLNAPGFENALVGVRLLLDGVPVVARIFQDDAEVKIAGVPGHTIQLKRAEGNEILIRHRPLGTLGEVKVTVQVGDPRRDFMPLPGEISAANNQIDTYVTVVKEGTRVLLVDKLRAWEPQFICDALGKDSKISLFPVWLRGNDKPDDDVRDLFRFEQRNYDAIIFGDVTAAQVKVLGNNVLEQIERMVFDKGTGFLMLGGYSTFGNSDWKGTPIEKLLPVMLDVQGQIDAPVKMVPTDDGLRRYSYILKISNQIAGAQGAWAKLKELDGQTKLGSLKPGLSSVLAESDSKEPLLVTQNYGKGRTLAFGADTSYKWIRDPESKQNHARFWAQMVRWLARQEEMEGSVLVIPDSRRIPANNELGFRVALRGKDGNELEAGKYQVQVFGPDGKAVRVPTSKKGTEERGVFLNSELSGEYKIEVEAEGKDPSGEVIAFLFQALLTYVSPKYMLARWLMIYGSILMMILLPAWRLAFLRLVFSALGQVSMLFVGTSSVLAEIGERVSSRPELGLQILGYVDDGSGNALPENIPRLGSIDELRGVTERTKPERIIVGMSERRARMPVYELLDLRLSGIHVEEASLLYETTFGRVSTRDLRPSQLVFSRELGPAPSSVAVQGFYSWVLALIGLTLLSPVMLVVALLVRLTSPGPILHRQTRVGLKDVPFTVFKFRSMRADAEARTGAVWASKNDPRITSIGKYLRLFRLDELPQFFNVLRGDMSFVGPRPERPEFVKALSEK